MHTGLAFAFDGYFFIMENEIWKDILGYEGLYQISNLGRVKSLERKIIRCDNFKYTIKERILKLPKTKCGYYNMQLYKNNKCKHFLLHRIIALSFLDNKNKELCVNHKNGIKHDNRIENLEFVSYSYNIKHAYDNKLKFPSKGKCKKIYQYDLNNNFISEHESSIEVQRKFGYSNGNINQCCHNKRKTSNGFIWKFKD